MRPFANRVNKHEPYANRKWNGRYLVTARTGCRSVFTYEMKLLSDFSRMSELFFLNIVPTSGFIWIFFCLMKYYFKLIVRDVLPEI